MAVMVVGGGDVDADTRTLRPGHLQRCPAGMNKQHLSVPVRGDEIDARRLWTEGRERRRHLRGDGKEAERERESVIECIE